MKKINKIIIIVSASMLLVVVILFFINRKQTNYTQPNGNNVPGSNLPPEQNRNTAPNSTSAADLLDNAVINLEDKLKSTPLPGKQTDDSTFLGKYGKFAFETLGKNPTITNLLKGLDKTFDPSMIETSSPSHTFQLNNGKNYLVFSGCTTGNCGGTERIIIYSEAENKVYMAVENESQTQLKIFGNPDDQERALLIYMYFHK